MNSPRSSSRRAHRHVGWFLTSCGLAAMVLLVAPESVEAASKSSYRLRRARSCQAVRNQLVDQLVEQYINRRYYRPRPRRRFSRGAAKMKPSARAPMAESADRAASTAGPGHYTTTNNQVVGVDEADRVKTDGRYIYTISGRDVVIIKSWPATSTSIVARYTPGSGAQPQQLFVNGNKLVVFSRTYSRIRPKSSWRGRSRRPYHRPGFAAARATILDITSRSNPRLIVNVDLEGTLLQARMIGSDIYTVTNAAMQLPSSFYQKLNKHVPTNYGYRRRRHPKYRYATAGNRSIWRSRVRSALASVNVSKLLPSVRFSYGTGHQAAQRPLVRCGDVYFPNGQSSMGLLTLSHFSLNGGRVGAAAVMASGWKVYASHHSLYVAANSSRSGRRGTDVHKFDLRRFQGPPSYVASGTVPGYLLNQFSMDEHMGNLRVATTENGSGWRRRGDIPTRPGSNIFVMRQRGNELQTVGSVQGLAPGERIYAARMMGDKGYLVTFRRTDPLYTIDLSNPRRPKVKGELKIPGFSSYIHPLGNGQLLTVGQDADNNGRVRGAHLQIFDVTDLKNPRRTYHQKLTFGYGSSRSAAQWDHHAFTYNARTKTLALPLTVHRYHKEGGNFAGVILVKVDPRKGFSELGSVQHSDLAASHYCKRTNPSYSCNANRYWNTPVQRSIFMDDYLFTLSTLGLKVHRLPKLSAVASLLTVR